MRVAVDTNVLVRTAIQATGPAAAVIEIVTAPPHLLIISEFILNELQRALTYPRVRARHSMSDAEIAEFASLLRDAGHVVPVGENIPPLSTDPEDDPVIATCISGQADVLCTLDRHFRQPLVQAYCATFNLRVLSDVELLAELRGGSQRPG